MRSFVANTISLRTGYYLIVDGGIMEHPVAHCVLVAFSYTAGVETLLHHLLLYLLCTVPVACSVLFRCAKIYLTQVLNAVGDAAGDDAI
jgi:hypothetical protein